MKHHSGKLRIIAGANRGRTVTFAAVNDLRPTADRVRETLFNWLANHIIDSRCLDLFAGSGALGLEALSRGAKSVRFVESNRKAVNALQSNIINFNTQAASITCQSALSYLSKTDEIFDIVFLDPPYQSELLKQSIQLLTKFKVLNQSAWIYTENSLHIDPPQVPDDWELYRTTKAGDTRACLYRVETLTDPATSTGQTSPGQV